MIVLGDKKEELRMFGAKVNAANYYLPVKPGDDTPPHKKRCERTSQPHHIAHILGRRYALTATSHKYLEIGIRVGPVPTVEIILSGNYGNQLIITAETWKKLMGKRDDIQRLLQADKPSFSPLLIQDLVMEFCKMHDSILVKLAISDKYLYLKPATMNTLFTYEYCIDHMYGWLSENLYLVSTKFKNFVNVLREKNIVEIYHAARAIRESSDYDSESLIDCELLACALKIIAYDAMNIL